MAMMRPAVCDPEMAQPPALGLALPLRDRPQRFVPDHTFRAQALEVGELI
jgi:hypothetical protein